MQTVSDLGLANSAARLLPKDTVCLSRTASVGYVVKMGREMATSQDFVTWSCLEPLDADFLMNALLAEGQDIRRFGEGSTHTTIYFPEVKAFHIDLPPKAEQRRIVAKLDALTARLARARAELDRVAALAEQIRQCVLRNAFEGMLTAQWRTDHPDASPVHPRRPSEIRSKYSSANQLAEPFQVPPSWRWLRLPELGNLDRGKSRHRPRNDPKLFGGPHPFIQTGDVRAAGQYLTSFSQTYSDFGLEQSRKWPIGSVCITIAANIAETTVLSIEACFPDSVVGFIADEERICAEYIEYFVRTAKSDLSRFAPATAQKNINLEILGLVSVPVPPRREQDEVVRLIKAAFARADRLEAEAARARALLDRLESAILAKAFRGELVPQDPHDEPASVLLDRIRAERAAAPKPKRGRRAAADA